MTISDLVEPDLDPDNELIAVLINANDEAQTITVSDLAGMDLLLHPVQMLSVDDVVRTASFDAATGTFNVPGRTPVVFVAEVPPQEHLEDLIDDIEALGDAGILNRGQSKALIVKLSHAISKLDGGQPDVALNMLSAFINEVNAFIQGGILTPEEGQSLLDAVNDIIDQILLRY
jgi:hypothetical protein